MQARQPEFKARGECGLRDKYCRSHHRRITAHYTLGPIRSIPGTGIKQRYFAMESVLGKGFPGSAICSP